MRDSAGISIVDQATCAGGERQHIVAETGPLVSIGGMDDDDYALFRVRAARRLSDGTIVVLNESSGEVRYYASDGEYLGAFGRPGRGPGEFMRFSSATQVFPGDTLVIYDAAQRRVTLLAPAGKSFDHVGIRPAGDMSVRMYIGRLPDGSHLVAHTSPRGQGLRPAGSVRDTIVLMIHDHSGAPRAEVGRFAGDETIVVERGPGSQVMTAPFGRQSSVLLAGGDFAVLDSGTGEINQYDTTGQLVTSIRRVVADIRLTDEHRSRFPREAFPGVSFPEFLPYYGSAMLTQLNEIAVSNIVAPGPDRTVTWELFERHGRGCRTVELPSEWTIFEFGAHDVLIMRRDDYGVEFAELWQLMQQS